MYYDCTIPCRQRDRHGHEAIHKQANQQGRRDRIDMASSDRERPERRTYRRSPGRQYGYDYNPLHSRSERSQSGQSKYRANMSQEERLPTRSEGSSRPSGAMSQRPDLRRTRQLLRQNIIASKGKAAVEAEEQREQFLQALPEEDAREQHEQRDGRNGQASRHYPSQNGRPQAYLPSTRELIEDPDDFEDGHWPEYVEERDPDLGIDYEDPLDARLGYTEMVPPRMERMATRAPARSARPMPEYEDEYEDDGYEDEEEPRQRRKRKKKVSRRGLLAGLGIVAIGGAGVAAYELVPKVPELAGTVSSNIERQLQDAFNRGVEQGANTVRQDFVNSLENLEGFTLDGAMTSVKLMRAAYDNFVSPIVKFGAAVATDFLTSMDRAFTTARGWLRNIGQDNSTLAAIQSVLDSWVAQVSNMPKQLDAITETDLDGAQAYLRALQNKLAQEKAKLAASQKGTPTPTAKPTGTPKP